MFRAFRSHGKPTASGEVSCPLHLTEPDSGMTALICGSLAYDTVMVFNGRFKEHILPDRIHMLSVAFMVPELRRNFGGCAGNIAYHLKLLGGDPLVAAAVGQDFDPYAAWMAKQGLSQECVARH